MDFGVRSVEEVRVGGEEMDLRVSIMRSLVLSIRAGTSAVVRPVVGIGGRTMNQLSYSTFMGVPAGCVSALCDEHPSGWSDR